MLRRLKQIIPGLWLSIALLFLSCRQAPSGEYDLVKSATSAMGMDIHQAVEASRYHHQWLPDEIMIEQDAFSPELQRSLESMGHTLKPLGSIGFVEAIWVDSQGTLHGAADPRGEDHASGW